MTTRLSFLLIEPDETFRKGWMELFETSDEAVARPAADAAAARGLLAEAPADLFLIGPGALSDVSTDLSALAGESFGAPILGLSGGEAVAAGCDQIMTLPVRFSDAMAMARALWRAHDQSSASEVIIGNHRFHAGERTLTRQGEDPISLTDKEVAILRFLSRSKAPVSRMRLLESVWGYQDGVTTHTIETHIYRLRQKIEPDPTAASILVTTEEGYTLGR